MFYKVRNNVQMGLATEMTLFSRNLGRQNATVSTAVFCTI